MTNSCITIVSTKFLDQKCRKNDYKARNHRKTNIFTQQMNINRPVITMIMIKSESQPDRREPGIDSARPLTSLKLPLPPPWPRPLLPPSDAGLFRRRRRRRPTIAGAALGLKSQFSVVQIVSFFMIISLTQKKKKDQFWREKSEFWKKFLKFRTRSDGNVRPVSCHFILYICRWVELH